MGYPSLGFICHELLFLMTKRRVRIHHANKIGAMNDLRSGEDRPPSWLSNSDRLEEFLSGVQTLSLSRNVPHGYVLHVLGDEVNYRRLICYTGALEARKATFAEQQIAIADLILEWWFSHVHAAEMTTEIVANQATPSTAATDRHTDL